MENSTAIRTFTNDNLGNIRILIDNDEIWFVAIDVCKCLEINNSRQAILKLDTDEKKSLYIENSGAGNPNKTIVNEAGLYNLILSSRKPEAKEFKRWITHEVIPSIRKYGAYMTPETIEKVLYNPEFIINLASQLKAEQEKNEVLTKENKALLTENDVLSGEIQTYDSRKILNALIRALTFRNYNGDYFYAWNSFYKQLKYKYGYDLKIRKGKSKDNTQPLITYLRDDEVGKAASLAAAMCKEAGLDLDMIINSVNAKNV